MHQHTVVQRHVMRGDSLGSLFQREPLPFVDGDADVRADEDADDDINCNFNQLFARITEN